VIAATNVDLRAALEQGRFREDLYSRLNVVPISIPPLRARKEDIPFLAIHFVRKLSKDLGTSVHEISPAAVDRLLEHPWPGNVRELENTIERSLVLAFWRYPTTGTILESKLHEVIMYRHHNRLRCCRKARLLSTGNR